MKKLIIGVVAAIGLAGCNTTEESFVGQNSKDDVESMVNVSYVQSQDEHAVGSLDIVPSEIFNNVNELAESSPIVIVGQVKSDRKSFEYSSVTFFESRIQVKDIYRDTEGKLNKNGTITLLQNDIYEVDPVVKKGEKVLLFLKKYEGPVIADAYRIIGLYQGHYKVSNEGKLVAVGNQKEHKLKDIDTFELSTLEKVLENSPYVQVNIGVPRTEEEIEAANEKEKQLQEEYSNNNDNN